MPAKPGYMLLHGTQGYRYDDTDPPHIMDEPRYFRGAAPALRGMLHRCGADKDLPGAKFEVNSWPNGYGKSPYYSAVFRLDRFDEKRLDTDGFKVTRVTPWEEVGDIAVEAPKPTDPVREEYVKGDAICKWNVGKQVHEVIVNGEVVFSSRDKETAEKVLSTEYTLAGVPAVDLHKLSA